MLIKQFEIWIADLNPQVGTEAGKTRPVLVVQTDLLNRIAHPSTIICPITTNINLDATILRVHLSQGTANILRDCDIMLDQIRAIDNTRLLRRVGTLPNHLAELVKQNIAIVLDIG